MARWCNGRSSWISPFRIPLPSKHSPHIHFSPLFSYHFVQREVGFERGSDRARGRGRRRAQKHTHAHTHTRAYTQTHTHVYTHKHSYTYTQTHPILRTYARTYMHTHMTLGQACTRPQEECGSSESVQECFEIHGATFKRTIENLIFTF